MNIDVGFKLIFIESYLGKTDYEYGMSVYFESSKCLNNFDILLFNEEVLQFKNLIDYCINNNQESKYQGGRSFLTESHKIALELYWGCAVDGHFDYCCYDQCFFFNKGLENKYIHYAVYTFLKYSPNCSAFIFWPSTFNMREERKKGVELIRNNFEIIYEIDLLLPFQGFYQLCYVLYKEFDWIKNALKGYSASFNDRVCSRFNSKGTMHLVFCNATKPQMLDIKRHELRPLFKIGYNSVHSCDNRDETLSLASIVLNNNSIYLFNNGYFSKNRDIVNYLLYKNIQEKEVYSENVYRLIYGCSATPAITIERSIINWDKNAFFNNCPILVPSYNCLPQRRKKYICYYHIYRFKLFLSTFCYL